jgi:hypothetical protein
VHGMPAGLQVKLRMHAIFCSLSPRPGPDTVVNMTENTRTEYERVDLLTGTTLRAVLVTTYTAQAQPILDSPFPPSLCGGVSITPTGNNVALSVGVAGVAENGAAEERKVILPGARLDTGPFSIDHTIGITVLPPTFGNTNILNLRQGELGNMSSRAEGSFFQDTKASLTFSLPPSAGSWQKVPLVLARMALSAAGKSCIKANLRTACVGDVPRGPSGFTELGGVGLNYIRQTSAGTDFSFLLTRDFPLGVVTMTHTRFVEDSWLPLINGAPTVKQLGSIKSHIRPITVLAPR